MIKPDIQTELYKYIAGILKSLDCTALQIGGTPDHHKKITFQDEYRKFLDDYQIVYDEKYIWD